MDRIELYFRIASNSYSICLTLAMSYCYMAWAAPFLEKRRTVWMCGAVYMAVKEIIVYIPIEVTNTVGYGIGTMSVFLIMCLADQGNVGQKFFLAVTFFCLRWQSLMIENCASNELYLLQHKIGEWMQGAVADDVFWLVSYIGLSVFELILAVLCMYGAVRLMLWAYGRRRRRMAGRELLILLVPSVSSVFAYEVIQFYNRIYERDSGKSVTDIYGYYDWLILLYSLVCFMTIFVMTYVFCQWKAEQEEEKQREVFSRQVQDLENHIAEVERLYRDMRSLRHDIGNHLMTLEQLYGRGEYEAAGKYAESLKLEVQKSPSDMVSGNPVTDVILSCRKKEMEEKGIVFDCRFHYPPGGGVNAFDISVILNNALANAVEAVERERSHREKTNMTIVSAYSYRMKNMYFIEVSNSFGGELVKDAQSGLPCTSKAGDGHGFGLVSIRHVAKKYLGDIEIVKEVHGGEECCVLRVMLQIFTHNR